MNAWLIIVIPTLIVPTLLGASPVLVKKDTLEMKRFVMVSYCIALIIDLTLKHIDINECMADNCDPNANCTNTPGSFTCTCNQGYTGDGRTCNGELHFYCINNKSNFEAHRYR